MEEQNREFKFKELFDSMIMLTRAFGIDLSPKLTKTNKDILEKYGIDKARSLIISITMDETFTFCYSWTVLKIFEKYPENNCKIGYDFLMKSSIDFMAHYSFMALNDEIRKNIFEADFFMGLFKKRLDEYGKYYMMSDIVFACYYLEIMNKTTERLEYYDQNKNEFDEKKLKMNAIEDIKWLDEKIDDLIKKYVVKI